MAIFIKKNGSLQNVSSFIKYNNALIRAGFKSLEELQPSYTYLSSLEVQKKTATTYDGTTEYSNESFISLDVGVPAGESVDVTFDNVTKTLTNNTNANAYMNVKFGTYFGVSDETTATSGTLVIDGNHYGFGQGKYTSKSDNSQDEKILLGQITKVNLISDSVTEIPDNAFMSCGGFSITIPSSVRSIGTSAFATCMLLNEIILSQNNQILNIGGSAFTMCNNLAGTFYFPNLVSIGSGIFYSSYQQKTVHFYNTLTTVDGTGNTMFGQISTSSNPLTYTLYFHFDDNDSVGFAMSSICGKGSSKATNTYNIYTDNTTIKDQSIALRDSYTTINVYHLDGTSW